MSSQRRDMERCPRSALHRVFNRETIRFFVIFILASLCKPVSSCGFGGQHNYGDMTGDSIVQEGAAFALECRLNTLNPTIKGVTYDVGPANIRFKFRNEVITERVEVINGTAARLNIPRASLDDSGYYYCFLDVPGAGNMTLVCSNHLRVGYAPGDIPSESFKCNSNYYNLTCAWDPPPTEIRTSYQVQEVVYGDVVRDCAIQETETSCRWSLASSPPYRHTEANFVFRLTSTNRLGSHVQYFEVNHFEIIRPSQPNDLAFKEVTANSVELTWKVPAYFDAEADHDDVYTPKLVYEVLHHPLGEVASSAVSTAVGATHSYKVENLIPFTTYVFSVRCKTTQAKGMRVWSEYVNATIATKQDVPYLSPTLQPNSYEVIKNSDVSRSITVYWEPVDNKFKNAAGPFWYVIYLLPTRFERKKRETFRGFNQLSVNVTSSAQSSYTFDGMSNSEAYMFKMYSVNTLGESKSFSAMKVAESSRLPEKPSGVTVFYLSPEEGYEVQWQKQQKLNRPIVSYTVSWCKTHVHTVDKCSGRLQTKDVAADYSDLRKPQSVRIVGLEDATYHFAVSANAQEVSGALISSGISWTACVIPKGIKRVEKINEVHAKARNSSAIDVSWKLPCPALSSVIEKYQVTICQERGGCRNVDVSNGTAEGYTISGLEPKTKYKVHFQAWTKYLPGEESDPTTVQTMAGAPEEPEGLKIFNVSRNSIALEWTSKRVPLSDIDRFTVFLNGIAHRHFDSPSAICKERQQKGYTCEALLDDDIKSFSTYRVGVVACSKSSESVFLCSKFSQLALATTQIGVPGVMDKPHVEVINATSVLVSWKRPPEANGPIDHYRLTIFSNQNVTRSVRVPGGKLSAYVPFECEGLEEAGETMAPQSHLIAIQAVNIDKATLELVGPGSAKTTVNACLFTSTSIWLIIAISVGAFVLLATILFAACAGARKVKRMYDEIKKPGIELPGGLAGQRLDLDRGATDKTAQLQKQLSESSADLSLDEYDFKYKTGSAASHSSASSTDSTSNGTSKSSGYVSHDAIVNFKTRSQSPAAGTHPAATSANSSPTPPASLAPEHEQQFVHTIDMLMSPVSEGCELRQDAVLYFGTGSSASVVSPVLAKCSDEGVSVELLDSSFVRQRNGYVALPSTSCNVNEGATRTQSNSVPTDVMV